MLKIYLQGLSSVDYVIIFTKKFGNQITLNDVQLVARRSLYNDPILTSEFIQITMCHLY